MTTRSNLRKKRQAKKKAGYGVTGPQRRVNEGEVISIGMNLFPKSFRCKMRYFDTVAISTGVSVAGTYVFSANGLYDPDVTGTGHQPMGFDQMMLSYEHYIGIRSRMTIQVRNTSSAQSAHIGIIQNSFATPNTDIQRNIENGHLVMQQLNATPYEGSMRTLTSIMDVAKFGTVKDILDDPEYQGNLSANPAEQSYFHISFWNTDNASVGTCIVNVTIEYEAIFREPRSLSVSVSSVLKKLLLDEMKVSTCLKESDAFDSCRKCGKH